MAYQTVTKTSYGSRLKNSLGGVFTGFILLIVGTVLLFWNEKRTIFTTRMLNEAQKVCVEMPDINSANADFNGKMIHASGLATTSDILTDNVFGVSENAIRLQRSVEYYQWVEHSKSETKDKVGGGQETVTTYTYDRQWVSSPVNSANFADPDYREVNEVITTIENQDIIAPNVTFGAYRFPEALTTQMSKKVPVNVSLDPEFVAAYDAAIKKGKAVNTEDSYLHVNNSTVYIGANPSAPAVGDVRVTFTKILPGEVSILAQVNGDTFEKFTAKNGYSLLTLKDGIDSAVHGRAQEQQDPRLGAPHPRHPAALPRLPQHFRHHRFPAEGPSVPGQHRRCGCQPRRFPPRADLGPDRHRRRLGVLPSGPGHRPADRRRRPGLLPGLQEQEVQGCRCSCRPGSSRFS